MRVNLQRNGLYLRHDLSQSTHRRMDVCFYHHIFEIKIRVTLTITLNEAWIFSHYYDTLFKNQFCMTNNITIVRIKTSKKGIYLGQNMRMGRYLRCLMGKDEVVYKFFDVFRPIRASLCRKLFQMKWMVLNHLSFFPFFHHCALFVNDFFYLK